MNDLNIITIAEFEQFAPEVGLSQYDNPTVSGMISQASRRVRDYLRYSPLAEDISNELKTAQITSEGDLLIYPDKVPVISVSSLNIKKGATSIALTLQDGNSNNKFNVDHTGRTIRYPFGEITLQGVPVFSDFWALRGTQFFTEMSYRGGWEVADLPTTIKEATVLFVRDILTHRNNAAGAHRITQGGITIQYSDTGGESDFVKDAKKILGVYRRIG